MKLTDKRFWMLVIVIASAAVASAQAVFSVEEISYVEYADAEKEYSRYNVIPADTIPDNEIVNMVLKESQTKFERLDSFTRREIYDFVEGFGIKTNNGYYIFQNLSCMVLLYPTLLLRILYGGLMLRVADTYVKRHSQRQ